MITKCEYDKAKKKALEFLKKANIVVTPAEKKRVEVADFGLGDLDRIGLELIVYVNTERCCAKELILFPWQICPQHRHPNIKKESGKEETFRCRWGKVFLYVPGEPAKKPKGRVPAERKEWFTVWHEIVLNPGEQYTLKPNTLHWFQAGPEGAVVSEFSTRSRDEADVFSDPEIQRITKLK